MESILHYCSMGLQLRRTWQTVIKLTAHPRIQQLPQTMAMRGPWVSLFPSQVKAAGMKDALQIGFWVSGSSISSVFLWNNNGLPILHTISSVHVDYSALMQQLSMKKDYYNNNKALIAQTWVGAPCKTMVPGDKSLSSEKAKTRGSLGLIGQPMHSMFSCIK